MSEDPVQKRLRDLLSESEVVTRRVEDGSTPSTQGIRAARKDPERVLGEYVLLREAGHGGMGTIYQAWDETLQRNVAIKFLGGVAGAEGLDRERFLREARTLARLRHAHIVGVHGFGFRGEVPYIVMEWVDGVPLGEWAQSGRRTVREVVAILAQVAAALDHAHRSGFIHRDVKPSNVLLEKIHPGGVPVARLIDFGLARDVLARPGEVTLRGVVGTPLYMAPEQIAGDSTRIGPATDIHGLGATLYHVATGQPPRYEAIEGRPTLVPPRRVATGIDRRLEAIILRAMRPDPEERYADMATFRRDLEELLNGGLAPIRRRTTQVAIALGVLLVGGMVLWLARDRPRTSAPNPPLAAGIDVSKLIEQARAATALTDVGKRDALLAEAIAELDRRAASRPEERDARLLRATVLRMQADFGEEALYARAVEALQGLDGPASAEERLRACFRLHLAPLPDYANAPEEGIRACREAAQAVLRTDGAAIAFAGALETYWKDGPAAALRLVSDGGADMCVLEGALLRYEGRPGESPAALVQAVQEAPFVKVAWQALIEAEMDQGALSSAERRVRALARARPGEPLWPYDGALLRAMDGDRAAAISDLRALREAHPDHLRILGDLAVLTLVDGDLAAARPLLEAYVVAAGRPWAPHARFHMFCLEVHEAVRDGDERALADVASRLAANLTPEGEVGEEYYTWEPDWTDPSTRFGFAFPLTAGAQRMDPLLDPLRSRKELWAAIERVLTRSRK